MYIHLWLTLTFILTDSHTHTRNHIQRVTEVFAHLQNFPFVALLDKKIERENYEKNVLPSRKCSKENYRSKRGENIKWMSLDQIIWKINEKLIHKSLYTAMFENDPCALIIRQHWNNPKKPHVVPDVSKWLSAKVIPLFHDVLLHLSGRECARLLENYNMKKEMSFKRRHLIIFHLTKGKSYSRIARLLQESRNTFAKIVQCFKNEDHLENAKGSVHPKIVMEHGKCPFMCIVKINLKISAPKLTSQFCEETRKRCSVEIQPHTWYFHHHVLP